MTTLAGDRQQRTAADSNHLSGAGDLLQIKNSLKHTYSVEAESYDAERSINGPTRLFFDVAYDTIDEMIGPTGESTVHVDMPVGTGRFLLHLRRRGRQHRMFGIDVAEGMITVCRHKAAKSRGNISLSFGDAFRLPLADASVDLLTSLRFFHLFPKRHWPSLIGEMHRVVRPGGLLITDMRNLFRGIACGLAKEYRDRLLHGDQPHSFVLPHQVRRLFRSWGEISTQGVGLDGLGLLSCRAPELVRRYQILGRYAPCRYLTKELLIKVRKARP